MKVKNLILLATALIFLGCSKTETDEYLLELDKKTLAENINYDKIMFYKFAKIAVRSSAVQDTSAASYQAFAKNSTHLFNSLNNISIDSGKTISVVDALLIYQDYRKVKGFVKETDEDIFPTAIEGFSKVYGDKSIKQTLLSGEAKIYSQNVEHAILSVATLGAKSLGPEFSLYECSKTQPEKLQDSEEKTLLEFIRGFLFLNNNLLYLSEDGFSRNINWLEKNKQIPLPLTKAFFGWQSLNDEQVNTSFHALNCLFRGMDRLKMKREVDEERALDDFELFVKDANQLGLQNELVWMVESYLYLKREKAEQAIVSLNKLKGSKILGKEEREAIEESVNYLKN
ncbi:MAG TPA: short-chain dehydrogenase, partial [Flavobacterium sp.]